MEVVWLVRDKSILLMSENEVFIACASAVLKGLENKHLAWCVFAELNAVDFGDYLRTPHFRLTP